MPDYKQLAREALQDLILKSKHAGKMRALTGRLDSNGDPVATVSSPVLQPGKIWVRPPGDHRAIAAWNVAKINPLAVNVPVYLQQDPNGEWEVAGIVNNSAVDTFGQSASQVVIPPIDGNSALVNIVKKNIGDLKTRITGDYSVYVNDYRSAKVRWYGDALDTTSYKPTAGNERWIVLYLDFTPELQVITGSTKSTGLLTIEDLYTELASLPDESIVCSGIKMSGDNSQLYEADIIDLREIFSEGGLLTTGGTVKVSSNDTTDDYLVGKLTAGNAISLTEGSDGSDEDLTIAVVETSISHLNLTDKGTNNHAQIDNHIAATTNPHSVTAAQAGAVADTGDTMTGQLYIDGGSDVVQLLIDADASQTADIFQIRDSTGQVHMAIEADGDLQLYEGGSKNHRFTSTTSWYNQTKVSAHAFRVDGGTNNYNLVVNASNENVGILAGGTPDQYSTIEFGDTKAVLLPRLTTTQRNALTAQNGMLIYNTTNSVVEAYEGGTWVNL